MLSYQHDYHAGNHADVLKHSVLALVIRALQRKDTPLRVLDAHAGSGIYDLRSGEARKNAEFAGGIERVLAAQALPAEVRDYLDAVRTLNGQGHDKADGKGRDFHLYPGSPQVARHLLRPQDHMELLELHPAALARLHRNFGRDPRVHIHDRNAFEGLPALVPPKEKRGVVLVDSAYEMKEDFTAVVELLKTCHGRWPTGVYVVWYPLIRHPLAERFTAKVRATAMPKILHVELRVEAEAFNGMRGSGLCIVNAPFGLDQKLNVLLPWLWATLKNDDRSGWKVEWLKPLLRRRQPALQPLLWILQLRPRDFVQPAAVHGLDQAGHNHLLLVADQRRDDEVLFLADGLHGCPLAQVEFFRVEADHPASMNQSSRQAWIFAAMTLAGVGVFGYATGVLMGPFAPVLGERLPELTCLQVAFTGERFAAVFGSFTPQQQTAIAQLLIPGDVVFAWGYGFLLTGLLGLLTLRLPAHWQRVGRVLMWTPLLASALDCLEDLCLHALAVAPSGSDPGLLPLLAGTAATLKYLNLSVLAPAYGIAGSIKGVAHDRRAGAVTIYLLVVVNALAFVARPLQQIPACF